MSHAIKTLGCYHEGTAVTFLYSLKDKNGDPVTAPTSIKYKLSDGVNVLIDWTTLDAVAPGEVVISGDKNMIDSIKERICTLHFISDNEDTYQPFKYVLINDPNITLDMP